MSNNFQDKLRAIHGHITPKSTPAKSSPPERYSMLAEQVRGSLIQSSAGAFVNVLKTYPYDFLYGEMRMEKRFAETEIALAPFVIKDEGRSVDPNKLLFIDTETTGLGGAGTVPFLIGVGYFTCDGFEVRQYLLPDYSDERGMLNSFLDEMGETSVIVSYNGMAFDIPVVQDRVIINRCERELKFQSHIDVLHATRRLFRRRLRDCSLMNLESALFAYHRGDDIPGYLIPSVFFDWVSNQKSDQMVEVLEHNRHDIVALCLLFFHLRDLFESNGNDIVQVDDLYSLSRLYGRRREHDRSMTACERILDIAGESVADDILLHHGFVCKRLGQHERAIECWTTLANKSGAPTKEGLRANEELAKLFEHQLRDLERAENHAARHLAGLQTSGLGEKLIERGRKRLERIHHKRFKP